MSKKTYVITGAQMGADPNNKFLNSLKQIVEKAEDGELKIMPLRGVSNHGRFIEIIKEEIKIIHELLLEDEAFQSILDFYELSVGQYRNKERDIIYIKKTDKTHMVEYEDRKDFILKFGKAYQKCVSEIYRLDDKEKEEENKLTHDEKACLKNVLKLAEKLEKKEDEIENLYPKEIRPFLVTANTKLELNNNVAINSLQISPTQVKPLTGLRRFVDRTTIFGAPKIQLEVVHSSNNKLPRLMMSTGACTEPLYSKSRVGAIAENDHTYGALIIEVVNDEEYHIRQLTANGNGEITDLGTRFSSHQEKEVGVEGLVLGDVHVMFLDPKVDAATEEMIEELKPKELIIHDIFDAFSISHWHQNDAILQAQKALQMLDHNGVRMHNSLEEELEQCAEYLVNKKRKFPGLKLVIVASNHDEAIDRCLKEGRFIKDPVNSVIGAKLFIEAVGGLSPLEAWVKKHSKFKEELQDIVFLSRDEDYRVEGIQCANHGDAGLSGAKGSVGAEEIGAGNSVIGHSHTPRIFNTVYQVGCSTFLKLSYNRGFSNWMNTHCVINKGGTRQLINIVNGKWRA